MVHRIDEKQAEHLNSLRAQALLFVEVLADGAANHLALDSESIYIAVGFSQPEKVLATGYAQLDEFVAPFDANLANAAVVVDRTSGGLFEIVAILDHGFPPPDPSRRFDVEFDLGADRAALVAR